MSSSERADADAVNVRVDGLLGDLTRSLSKKEQKTHGVTREPAEGDASAATDLKQRPDVHVEAQVGEPGGDDFGSSVVTILAHLCHQQSRVSAFLLLEIGNSDSLGKPGERRRNGGSVGVVFASHSVPVVGQRDLLVFAKLTAVRAAHHPGAGLVFAKHRLHGVSYFPH